MNLGRHLFLGEVELITKFFHFLQYAQSKPHDNMLRLFPLDKTIVFHFYDFVLVLSVVSSRCQLYSVSLSQRKLIPNSALFILPFREFYA